jgi:NTE family protein
MRQLSILLFAGLLPLYAWPSFASPAPEQASESQVRPKIGLVLSGGGAKGAAHIGVLKFLEQQHIPIDYIAGTSIGAYVGGMYALGYSADEIEKLMMQTDWSSGYSDIIPRGALSYRDKQQRDQFNIPLDVGYREGEVKAPNGLLQGQTMSRLLRQSTDLVEQFGSFDELTIPFRAVATDLETSEAVVLSSGSLVLAMQASAAVPGALQPVEIDGKLLVDGGIANNLPIDVVKAMGADIVIAVDIGSPLVSKDRLNSTLAVLDQLSNMLTNASTERQKQLLTDNDVLIRPGIDGLSTTDFSIMAKALPLGAEAALAEQGRLAPLSIGKSDFLVYSATKAHRSQQWMSELPRPLVRIELDNRSKVSDTLIRETLGLSEGETVTKARLDAGIARVYALNKFERVYAEFEDGPDGRELTLTTQAKSWGPNYFQVGFNWEDDFQLDSAFTLDLAYTMTNLTDNGGEWRNELRLGYQKRVATEFYQPLDRDQQFYSRSRYQYDKRTWNWYDGNNLAFRLDKSTHSIEQGVGYNYLPQGLLELGLVGAKGVFSNDALLIRDLSFDSWGGYFKFGYDSLNSISFPTEGNRFSLSVYRRKEDYNNDGSEEEDFFTSYEADWKGALSVGNHAFVGKVSLGTVEEEGEASLNLYELGGFLNLSGYHKDVLVGAHKLFGAFIYQYDLGRDALGMTQFPLYLGSSVEAGNLWFVRDDVALDDLIFSGSLYIGTDTDLGPAAIGVGLNDNGESAFYLFIGKNF